MVVFGEMHFRGSWSVSGYVMMKQLQLPIRSLLKSFCIEKMPMKQESALTCGVAAAQESETFHTVVPQSGKTLSSLLAKRALCGVGDFLLILLLLETVLTNSQYF